MEVENSSPTPFSNPQKQDCCSYPLMDERRYICENCGTEEIYQRFENNPTEEPKACCAPLKKKKGQICKSKPGKDGHCLRHSKQPSQQEDEEENIPFGGKIALKAIVKKLRQIAKTAGLKGYSRLNKEKLMKFIEEKTARKFTHEEVFTSKCLKTIAKRRDITNYSQKRRDELNWYLIWANLKIYLSSSELPILSLTGNDLEKGS